MPCSDGGPSREQIDDARYVPALLCAVLSLLESEGRPDILGAINYEEAGITESWAARWWKDHKAEDARRRASERRQRDRDATKQQALAKLSHAERSALGL